MERFYKRKESESSSSNKVPEKVNLDDLSWDPSERKPISSYHPNKKDEVRRAYLIRGPCQPRGHEFPKKIVSGRARRFRPDWFDQYGNWLEYSIKTDKAFCLCCYLFKDGGSQKDAFVTDGFGNWNKTDRFMVHVGDVNSFHNNSVKKCEDLLRQNQSIHAAFEKQSDRKKYEYRVILGSSVSFSKQLLNGGLSFHGHDESEESFNRGNFLEFLKWLGEQNEEIGKVILKNAPGNCPMTSPKVQKDIWATYSLSQALQRKDQDLLNAVSLVNTTKQKLQKLRADGFHSFLEEVMSFCEEHDIVTVNKSDEYINPKNKRQRTNITYHHYYEFDCFNTVLDMQIQEFGDRFNEVTSELLMCMITLTPCDNFREFDIGKALRLVEMYPNDFDDDDKRKLKFELATYVDN